VPTDRPLISTRVGIHLFVHLLLSMIEVFVTSFLLFSGLYVLLSFASSQTRSVEWNSRVVSNVHAVISVCGGVFCFLLNDETAYTTPMQAAFGESGSRNTVLMFTTGYLCYDLLLCIIYRSEIGDRLTMIHHSLILIAFSWGVYTQIGTYYMTSLLINEVSTPCVNINYFLASTPGMKDGTSYKINGIALFITFLFFRVIFNLWVIYHMIMETYFPLSYLVFPGPRQLPHRRLFSCFSLSGLAIAHGVINLIWFNVLTKAVWRKLRRKDKQQ